MISLVYLLSGSGDIYEIYKYKNDHIIKTTKLMADNISILKYLNSLFSMIFKSTDLTPKIKNIWTFYHYIHHTLLRYY